MRDPETGRLRDDAEAKTKRPGGWSWSCCQAEGRLGMGCNNGHHKMEDESSDEESGEKSDEGRTDLMRGRGFGRITR